MKLVRIVALICPIVALMNLALAHAQAPSKEGSAFDLRDFLWRNNPLLREATPRIHFYAGPHLLRTTSDSVKIGWVQHYASQLAPSWDQAHAVAVDRAGNIYVTGASTKLPYGVDCLTIKYDAAGKEVWAVRYNGAVDGDDSGAAIAVDASGNVYVTGSSVGSGTSRDYVTIKYNSAGAEQWVVGYNGPRNDEDYAVAIVIDNSGNVYVAGTSGSHPNGDYATIKYNSAGAELWVARYNGPANDSDYANALAVDTVGNVYVTGGSWGEGTYADYATIKYNSAGVQQWVDRYDGPISEFDVANAIVLDGNGNVYVTGESRKAGSVFYAEDDYATIKYNANGIRQWVARHNGPGDGYDEAYHMTVDALGNVYVTGRSQAASGWIGDYDFATLKYNPAGIQQWVARYDGLGNSFDFARGLAVDAAGNVYVTGSSDGPETQTDYATVKFGPEGDQKWIARYSGPGNEIDYPAAIKVDHTGNVYVTGESEGVGTRRDYATIKYNSDGAQQWMARYNGPANSTDRVEAIALDKFGNVYVTGQSWDPATFYDFATIKYNAHGIEQWVARYNGPSNFSDFTNGLAVDALGNAYVIGSNNTIIKYDEKGIQEWIVRHDQPESGYARGIALDASGNIYVTRSSNSYPENDHTIAKYNSNGVEQWIVRYQGASAKALAVDFADNVYVAGSTSGALWSMFTTIKYTQSASGLRTPSGYWLAQNHPNPFYYATTIRYAVPTIGHVTLKVYNLLGQEVETMVSAEHIAGVHEISWGGGTLPSGVYVYRLQANGFTETKKLVLLK